MSNECETVVASNARLLLVEPDIQSRDWLQRTLARGGREIWFAGSCAEARALSQRTPGPDVAVVSTELPDGCGIELIAELRRHAATSECVAISARPTVEAAARAMRLGASDFLTKPLCDPRAISNSVEWALSRACLQQQQHRQEQNLVEREERYALALEATKDGLWDWDLINNALYLSNRWKQLLGLDGTELGNSPDEWFSRVHPADRAELRSVVATALMKEGGRFEVDYRMQTHYGSYLWVRSRGVSVQDEQGVTTRVAGTMSDITRSKKVEERLVHEALHDGLTRLSNRVAFHHKLLEAFERQRISQGRDSFAVLFVDLDRFKNVNDSLGHQAGDKLLVEIARRLQDSLRESDELARLGGDEFAILLSSVKDMREVAPVLRRIENELRAPCLVEGHPIVPSASIGVAFGAGDCDSPETLLRNADLAMYKAKHRGRGRAEVFDQRMHAAALEKFHLEADLREALEEEQLQVRYQPIFDLRTNTLAGFEALARWQHPDSGWIAPQKFVQIAEECELILPLGDWVLEEACKQLAQWQERMGDSLWMSVNLSPMQVFDPGIVERISGVLDRTGIAPQSLKLEITEGVFIGKMDRAADTLQRLKSLGLQLSLDDFGTGYSSLSYLNRLPFDMLKIDRSFVVGIEREERCLVQAIVSMAQALGIDVVAEGIEEQSQLEILRERGCDFGQGYYFSRPIDAGAASMMVRSLATKRRARRCSMMRAKPATDLDAGWVLLS